MVDGTDSLGRESDTVATVAVASAAYRVDELPGGRKETRSQQDLDRIAREERPDADVPGQVRRQVQGVVPAAPSVATSTRAGGGSVSQMRTVKSPEHEASRVPSRLKATAWT